MNVERRHWIVGAAGLLAVVSLAAWSYNYLDDRRSDAIASMAEAQTCEQLARDIASLRRRGAATLASEPARRVELNRQIAQAAADGGLPARSVERIEHDPPRHVGASGNLLERPTRIAIGRTTLRQFAAMLEALDHPAEGICVTHVHLIAPDDANDSGTWTAEATLTDAVSATANGPAAPFSPQ